MRYHADDRRKFWGAIFDLPDGDLNVVKLKRHVPIAWHRHEFQTDRLFCVLGRVRVGLRYEYGDEDAHGSFVILTEGQTLVIPPKVWHGYEGLTKDATLVQFNSPQYNPSDEGRHPINEEMPWT